jgi:hypothetical protein
MRHERSIGIAARAVTFCVFTFYASAGCSSQSSNQPTTRPSGGYDRQEQAIKDPFGYTPDVRNSDTTRTGSSGVGEWDREGLKKDLEHVFNP